MKKATFISLLVFLIALAGCEIKTPEIRGVVLDAETKQPVEGAWVHATLEVKTKTIAGPVQTIIRVEPAHTRSDKDGKFVVPSKSFEKPSAQTGWGTRIENFSINASTLDDKRDGFYLKHYEGKKSIEVNLYLKTSGNRTNEREYFSYIQSLYTYCLNGRFGIEIPAVEGGCDDWELNFALIKHERYLQKWVGVKKIDEKARYANTLNQLAYLYEGKGDAQKAIKTYKELMDFEGPEGWFYKSAEIRIKKLKEKESNKPP